MAEARSLRGRGRILFFMALLHMMCHGLLSLLTPLYVAIQEDFALARVEPVTALSTWGAVTFALATLMVGLFVDRVPSKAVAGLGLIVHGLGLVAMAGAPTIGWARFWIVIAAVGAAGYHPVAARVIVGLYPEAVGRAVGLAGVGAGLGFFLGPWFSGRVAAIAGWRAAMAWAGWFGVGAAVAYFLLTPEPEFSDGRRDPGAPGSARRDKVLYLVALVVLGLLLIPRDFAGVGLDALNSLFLQRAWGLDIALVGALLGYKGLISLVTNPLLATLSDRGHRLWWWAGTLCLSALFASLIPWLPLSLAKVALILHGVFLLANYPIFESALVERVPARLRGRTYAMILTIVGVFSAFSFKLVGARVDALVEESAATVAPELFRALYAGMAAVLVVALLGVPLLTMLKKRGERLEK